MTVFLVYFSSDHVIEIEAEEIKNLGNGIVALLTDGRTVATFSYAQIVGIVQKDATHNTPTRH